ncbi:MAG TPA: dephospho-CoA kinase [Clostridiales bacterium]|nr:dephospho-CoA kinase [Clostridiales bacterium]
MKLIGLCGRSGSGKSECSRFISEMRIAVIDSDIVYRSLTVKGSPLLKELTDSFGVGIIDENGSLDRKKLSRIVFNDDKHLTKLNNITHKHILKNIIEWAEKAALSSKGGLVVVQAPLLFESGFNEKCDITVCVLTSDEQCLNRLQNRDELSPEQAKIRLSKQKDNSFLKKKCDYIINNDSDLITLKKNTERVFTEIIGVKE